MDGMHDVGGMHGFGAVRIREQDYVFRADWQRRSFALTQALAGVTPFGADLHRQEIERIEPAAYLAMDYFDKWTVATTSLLEKAGLVTRQELNSSQKLFVVSLDKRRPIAAAALVDAMRKGVELSFPENSAKPKFTSGQSVSVRNLSQKGHTRVPRYLRGAIGTVAGDAGVFQFADAVAAGRGKEPQHCYTVAFAARQLWGDDAEADDTLYADLWESYLEAA